MPPNSLSCSYNPGGGENDPGFPGNGGTGWGIFTPSSNHTGGVNVVFMDGAVRFVSDAINTGDPNGLQGGMGTRPTHVVYTDDGNVDDTLSAVNEGQSNFGVWGGLGTPAGGESTSL